MQISQVAASSSTDVVLAAVKAASRNGQPRKFVKLVFRYEQIAFELHQTSCLKLLKRVAPKVS